MSEIETIEHKGLTIRMYEDQDAESPREWRNLGTMAAWHRDYDLGDTNHGGWGNDKQGFIDHINGPECLVKLPLYLLDHSGLWMSTSRFMEDSQGWDTSHVGFIYVDKATVRKEYSCKRITAKVKEQATQVLEQEVATYNQYLTGDIYGYVVEDEDGRHLDSCWGFYEYDYVIEQAKKAADYEVEKIQRKNDHAALFTDNVMSA
jgi:hypothetical protein